MGYSPWGHKALETTEHTWALSIVVLLLVLELTSILFSKMAAQVYIPKNTVEEFAFLHNFYSIYYL